MWPRSCARASAASIQKENLNMVSFQVEKWRAIRAEMEPILVAHWHEIALGHAEVPLDIDHDRYDNLCDAGALHIVTVRDDGVLVGYHAAIIAGHLHYKSTLHGITDVYFILPEYRRGYTGIRLFRRVRSEMRLLGVKKLITAAKLHTADGNSGKLFEFLGYDATETVYTMLIKD